MQRRLSLAGGSSVAVEEAHTSASIHEIFDLCTGGPVIGVFQGCVYQQETVQLRSGDLLFAFTDGVTGSAQQPGR
ncbi:MAG: SpoIIE family protein phosphatase [Pyrinomonadaceae bacterium]